MSPIGCLHLAWQYLARHRVQSLLLALSLGLTLSLPVLVSLFVRIASGEFRARAAATPLVLGAKGSALELTLNALYFRRHGIEFSSMKNAETVRASGLADAIPLHVRFHSQGAPIVGTTLDYFSFRHLPVRDGIMIARLGDCVIGTKLARARSIKPGDAIYSSPEQVFDIAGTYPLKMRVTGILAESQSADDEAIFVDVKTSWLIEGIAHGHEDLIKAPESAVIEKQQGNVTANNSVRLFNEVTDANIASFHFHGEAGEYPLSTVIVVPHDDKSQAILLGRYQDGRLGVQIVRPAQEMDALLATLFHAQRLALVLLGALALVVLFIAALVFALSFKMRRVEFATLEDIGVSRAAVLVVKACEVLLVGTAALSLLALVWWVVSRFGAAWVRLGVN